MSEHSGSAIDRLVKKHRYVSLSLSAWSPCTLSPLNNVQSRIDRFGSGSNYASGSRIVPDVALETYATLKHFASIPVSTNTVTHGPPKLPRELMFIVLAQLHNDRPTLQMCMFVCRAWLNECRSHLFQTAHISDALYPLNRGLRNRSNRVQTFVDFLKQGASPGLCSSIRVIRLAGLEKSSEAHQRTRINIAMLASILDSLPRLRVLDLTRLVLGRGTPVKYRTQKFTLDALAMHQVSCSIDEAAGMFDVLGLFSAVNLLDASYVDIPALARPEQDESSISTSFQVSEVRLKGCLRGQDRPELRRLSTVHRLLEMLHDLPGTPKLRSLTVQCGVMAEVRALGRLLTQVGESIEHLAIEMFELTREHIGMLLAFVLSPFVSRGARLDPETVVLSLHLEKCTQLKFLRLSIFPNTSEGSRNAAASVCFAMLIASLSVEIRRLDVILGYNDMLMGNLTTFKWDAIQDASWRRLKNLEAVTFGLMPHRSDPTIEINARQFISNQLSSLRLRNILRFDDTKVSTGRTLVVLRYPEQLAPGVLVLKDLWIIYTLHLASHSNTSACNYVLDEYVHHSSPIQLIQSSNRQMPSCSPVPPLLAQAGDACGTVVRTCAGDAR